MGFLCLRQSILQSGGMMFSTHPFIICPIGLPILRTRYVRATKQVNGESQNLTPPPRHAQTPQAIVIQIGTGDYVVDPYTCAKVRYVSLPRMRDFAHQNVSFWVFLGSCNSLQARALGGF